MALAKLEDAEVAADGIERFIRRHVGESDGARWYRARLRPSLEVSIDFQPLDQTTTSSELLPSTAHHLTTALPCRQMGPLVQAASGAGVATRLAAFVLEQFPFALAAVREVLDACGANRIGPRDPSRV